MSNKQAIAILDEMIEREMKNKTYCAWVLKEAKERIEALPD